MQVTETLSEGLKRAFTVVLPHGPVETRRSERLAEIGKTLSLPGFRPGKVPTIIVRQRFGAEVTGEVVEESVRNAVQRVIEERGLRPAMQPSIDLLNKDALTPTGVTGDLEIKIDLEILPEIILPDFSQVEVTRLQAEVDDAAIDRALSNIARRGQTLEDIGLEELAGRGAEPGEILVCDYVGRIDGEAFAGGTQNDALIEVGGAGFIPGFTDQIVGLKLGESRAITVTFPENYGSKEFAGKTAEFLISAKALKRAKVPPMDDAFAKNLSFDNLDEFKGFVRKRIQEEYDQQSRTRLKRELLDRLSEQVSYPLPPTMVENEFTQIWARLEADRKAGSLDDEDKAKDEDTLRGEYRAIAERRVRLGLLLAEVGRQANVGITQEELNRAIRAEAAKHPGEEKAVMEFFRANPGATDMLRGPIFEDKAIDLVIAQVKMAVRQVTAEELSAEPDSEVAVAEASSEPTAEATTSESQVNVG